MLKTPVVIAVIAVALNAVNGVAAERVQPGKWETKLKIGKGAASAATYCISSAEAASMNGDAASLRRYVEKSTAEKTNGRCAMSKLELSGNRVVVTVACGKTVMVSTTKYFGDRYESTTSDGTTITGKRLGACTKS